MSEFPDADDLDALIAVLEDWQSRSLTILRVALDAGGTNGRVAFEGYDCCSEEPERIRLKLGDIEGAADFCNRATAIAERLPEGLTVESTCIAIAGPPPPDDSDMIHISNWNPLEVTPEGVIYGQDFYFAGEPPSDSSIPFLPSSLCPAGRTWVLNDMVACSWGLIQIGRRNLFHTYFHRRDFFSRESPEEEGEVEEDETKWTLPEGLGTSDCLVLNMGTGLGCGYIKALSSVPGIPPNTFTPIPLEGGHMQPPMFPADLDERIHAIIRGWLERKYGSAPGPHGRTMNEVEDVLSGGAGITNVYYAMRALSALREVPLGSFDLPQEQYKPRSIQGDFVGPVLTAHPEVAEHQWRVLFYFARQIATLHPTIKSFIICGNNAARETVQDLLFRNRETLRDTFQLAGERVHWLDQVKCYVVVSQADEEKHVNYNIFGASEFMKMKMEEIYEREGGRRGGRGLKVKNVIKKALVPALAGLAGFGVGLAVAKWRKWF